MGGAHSAKYDSGVTPAIAINRKLQVVEVHRSENRCKLYYRVGRLDLQNRCVRWGGSVKYDSGEQPSVALDDRGNVFEVHSSENFSTLYTRNGVLDAERHRIEWCHSAVKYDKGTQPHIAMNNKGDIIEVHKSERRDALFLRIGKLGYTNLGHPLVRWLTRSAVLYDSGLMPSISIDDFGNVVEMHQSESRERLFYRVGVLLLKEGKEGTVEEGKIEWGGSKSYDSGVQPNVSIAAVYPKNKKRSEEQEEAQENRAEAIVVVETHKAEASNDLWANWAVLRRDEKRLEWRTSRKFGKGVGPRVSAVHPNASSEGEEEEEEEGVVWFVSTHKSETNDTLWSNCGYLQSVQSLNWC
ncbi:hypothetical protein QOT17_014390 [Balamuthia mandrillaris]